MDRRTFVASILTALAASALPALTQSQAEVLMVGSLTGKSDHITTGSVSIQRIDGRLYAVLGPDFSLDGAPDPTLGFGQDGFVKTSEFAALRDLTGQQVYRLPQTLDPSEYNEFYVWCAQFSVPLGVAELRPR